MWNVKFDFRGWEYTDPLLFLNVNTVSNVLGLEEKIFYLFLKVNLCQDLQNRFEHNFNDLIADPQRFSLKN